MVFQTDATPLYVPLILAATIWRFVAYGATWQVKCEPCWGFHSEHKGVRTNDEYMIPASCQLEPRLALIGANLK